MATSVHPLEQQVSMFQRRGSLVDSFNWFVLIKKILLECFHLIADSEESDDEGGLGNVNRVVLRPPGHSGKAKKGHLCMDASFETGLRDQFQLIHQFLEDFDF